MSTWTGSDVWTGSDSWSAAHGASIPSGTGSGSWAFAGTATGARASAGSAAGSWVFTGAAAGARVAGGTASGTWTWVGAATGSAPSSFTAPTGLTATPFSTSRIDLAWNAVSTALGYDIERDGVVIVTDHPLTTYSDTGLADATEYDYRVRAAK